MEGLTFLGWSRASSSFLETPEFLPGDVTVTNGKDWNLYPVYKLKDKNRYPIYFYDPMHDTVTTCYVSKGQTSITTPKSSFNEGQYSLYWTTQRTSGLPDAFSYWEAGTDMPLTDEFFDEYNNPILIAYWDFQQETLILNYNYDNKKEEVKVTEDQYTLPSPERDGYIFLGWSRDNQEVDYPGGFSYHIPIHGEELFARWEPIRFTVEYYDGISGALLEVDEDVTVGRAIRKYPTTRVSIPGLRFYGWTTAVLTNSPKERLPWLYRENNEVIALPLLEPGYATDSLPYDKGTVKLYSVYEVKDKTNYGEVMLVYLPNGGKTAPTPSRYKANGNLKVTSDEMQRDGYVFDGWELLNLYSGNNPTLYPSGSSLAYRCTSGETIFLLAHWTPKQKVRLDVGIEGISEIDLSKEYGYGDIIKAKDLESKLPAYDGYHLISWVVITENAVKTYGVNEYIKFPLGDVTIRAVWMQNSFYIHYHSGFNSSLSVPVYVDGPLDSSYFEKKTFRWINVDGFTFIGWTTTNPQGKPWGASSPAIITWSDSNPITPTDDIHLYAYYKEDNPLKPGYKRIVYDDNGGTGGPGVQDVNPIGNKPLISNITPHKDGCEFDFWCVNERGAFLPVDESYIQRSEEDVIVLTAFWHERDKNVDLKDELQARYGKTIMPDYYFESEYESTEWKKIDKYTYFVISTKNKRDSEHYTKYQTTALIIQWKDGKWVLEGGSASHNLMKIAEYGAMTRFSDGVGFGVILGLKGGLTVLKHFEYTKWIAYAIEIEGAIADVIDSFKKDDILNKASIRASSKLADKLYRRYLEITGNENDAYKALSTVLPSLQTWVFDSLSAHRVDLVKSLKLLKSLAKCSKLEYKFKIKEAQEAFKSLNSSVSLDISKTIDMFEYQRLETISGLSDFPDWGFDLLEFCWDSAIDTIEYLGKRKELDPFGNHNDALVTFQNEITKHGFSEKIKKDFPEIIQNIYAAYYGLD